MAKDKKKNKDPDKKAALQAKKEAKADKSTRKRLQKEAGSSSTAALPDAEQLDDLLQAYRRKHPDVETTVLEPLETDFPAARANASLTLAEETNKMYLFGGEYYDGVENVVVDELLQYDINKQQWKRVLTPQQQPRPGARCAHSTVYYKQALYVFGGEFATAESYHHYKDVWKFDLKERTWVELLPHKGSAATPPTARSGHAAFVWKNYMIVFGGFYEAQRDTKWYQDLYVLDLLTEKWVPLPEPSRLSARPEPRSACNVAVLTDNAAVIQGGFSKLKKSSTAAATAMMGSPNSSTYESKVHTDAWKLHLSPLLQNKPPTWERLPHMKTNVSPTLTPLGRAGMASVAYKNQMLVWGGVCDTEHHHHVLQSVFYNDMWVLDLERRKWFPWRIQERKSDPTPDKRRRRKQQPIDTVDKQGLGNAKADEETNQDDGDDGKESEEELDEEEEEEEERGDSADMNSHAWNLEKLRSNMFAFIDAKGNIVYEKISVEDDTEVAISIETKRGGNIVDKEEEEEKGDDEEEEEEKEEESEEEKPKAKVDKIAFLDENVKSTNSKAKVASSKDSFKPVTSSSVMALNPETKHPEPVALPEPLPRINGEMVLYGNTLYLYGGLLEVGDREVTLDDFWKLDLRKRDKWECLYPGTMHKQVWRGAVHDDDDSYVSTGADEEEDDEDEDDDDAAEDNDDDEEEEEEEEKDNTGEDNLNKKKKEKKKKLKAKQLGLEDGVNRIPQKNETVADFYARTSDYWNEQASAAAVQDGGESLSTKDIRRDGFQLARKQFEKVQLTDADRLHDDLNLQDAKQEKMNERDEQRKSRRYR